MGGKEIQQILQKCQRAKALGCSVVEYEIEQGELRIKAFDFNNEGGEVLYVPYYPEGQNMQEFGIPSEIKEIRFGEGASKMLEQYWNSAFDLNMQINSFDITSEDDEDKVSAEVQEAFVQELTRYKPTLTKVNKITVTTQEEYERLISRPMYAGVMVVLENSGIGLEETQMPSIYKMNRLLHIFVQDVLENWMCRNVYNLVADGSDMGEDGTEGVEKDEYGGGYHTDGYFGDEVSVAEKRLIKRFLTLLKDFTFDSKVFGTEEDTFVWGLTHKFMEMVVNPYDIRVMKMYEHWKEYMEKYRKKLQFCEENFSRHDLYCDAVVEANSCDDSGFLRGKEGSWLYVMDVLGLDVNKLLQKDRQIPLSRIQKWFKERNSFTEAFDDAEECKNWRDDVHTSEKVQRVFEELGEAKLHDWAWGRLSVFHKVEMVGAPKDIRWVLRYMLFYIRMALRLNEYVTHKQDEEEQEELDITQFADKVRMRTEYGMLLFAWGNFISAVCFSPIVQEQSTSEDYRRMVWRQYLVLCYYRKLLGREITLDIEGRLENQLENSIRKALMEYINIQDVKQLDMVQQEKLEARVEVICYELYHSLKGMLEDMRLMESMRQEKTVLELYDIEKYIEDVINQIRKTGKFNRADIEILKYRELFELTGEFIVQTNYEQFRKTATKISRSRGRSGGISN